jgi:hypothetical protein
VRRMRCAHERIKMRVGMRWIKSEGKRHLKDLGVDVRIILI